MRAGATAALASEYTSAPAASEPELRAHDAITRHVHTIAPSLPARFGAFFDDRESLTRALAARDASLHEAIDRIGTRIELGVTLRWRAAPAPRRSETRSGREYMAVLAAREREKSEAEEIVERLIAELAYERALIQRRICPYDGVAATVAVLTTRDEETNVREQILRYGRNASAVTTDVYGPYPPYSFVS